MPEPMTDAERLRLLRDVSQTLFANTESWTESAAIGGNIAYLLDAISRGPTVDDPRESFMYIDKDLEGEFAELMQDTFDPSHPVWNYCRPA
jgi:hypothetical protein